MVVPGSIARFMPTEERANLTIDNKHLAKRRWHRDCHVTPNRCQFGSAWQNAAKRIA